MFFSRSSGPSQQTGTACPKTCPQTPHINRQNRPRRPFACIAHIELSGINLALDMASRNATYGLPFDFVRDWLFVANDEAKHFMLLSDRLESLDSFYGALPAHDGLWEAALATRDDLAGRLAIAPLVLEARGLDVTPQLIDKVKSVGDEASAEIMQIIIVD